VVQQTLLMFTFRLLLSVAQGAVGFSQRQMRMLDMHPSRIAAVPDGEAAQAWKAHPQSNLNPFLLFSLGKRFWSDSGCGMESDIARENGVWDPKTLDKNTEEGVLAEVS
jgi:hypothetical protein